MKTWYSKDEQKWVSEVPRSFWVGVNDYKTGEKIYSDDVIYEHWIMRDELNHHPYIYMLNVTVNYKHKYPVFNIRHFENMYYVKK